eukprot:3841441-Rhodomonas_salina.1
MDREVTVKDGGMYAHEGGAGEERTERAVWRRNSSRDNPSEVSCEGSNSEIIEVSCAGSISESILGAEERPRFRGPAHDICGGRKITTCVAACTAEERGGIPGCWSGVFLTGEEASTVVTVGSSLTLVYTYPVPKTPTMPSVRQVIADTSDA